MQFASECASGLLKAPRTGVKKAEAKADGFRAAASRDFSLSPNFLASLSEDFLLFPLLKTKTHKIASLVSFLFWLLKIDHQQRPSTITKSKTDSHTSMHILLPSFRKIFTSSAKTRK